MNYVLDGILLRRPEAADVDALYTFKNDPEIAAMLVGFTTGYSRQDLQDWVEFHRKQRDEVLFAIASEEENRCIGHVGLYQIDYRVRSAEFGILIGDRAYWGKGVGRACTLFCLAYGFDQLNLNRISLTVLATNPRARRLYETLGFHSEGVHRQAQYKDGQWIDVEQMSILRDEYRPETSWLRPHSAQSSAA